MGKVSISFYLGAEECVDVDDDISMMMRMATKVKTMMTKVKRMTITSVFLLQAPGILGCSAGQDFQGCDCHLYHHQPHHKYHRHQPHYHAYSTTDSPYSGKSISFAHCCLNFAVLAEYCTDPFSHAPAEVGWSGTCAMLADYY